MFDVNVAYGNGKINLNYFHKLQRFFERLWNDNCAFTESCVHTKMSVISVKSRKQNQNKLTLIRRVWCVQASKNGFFPCF